MPPPLAGREEMSFFKYIDHQSNTKNVCKKIHEKILNGSEEIEEYIVYPKWT